MQATGSWHLLELLFLPSRGFVWHAEALPCFRLQCFTCSSVDLCVKRLARNGNY